MPDCVENWRDELAAIIEAQPGLIAWHFWLGDRCCAMGAVIGKQDDWYNAYECDNPDGWARAVRLGLAEWHRDDDVRDTRCIRYTQRGRDLVDRNNNFGSETNNAYSPEVCEARKAYVLDWIHNQAI
jgi:hypothetical protein